MSQPLIWFASSRSSLPEVFLEKCVLKICSKVTGEHPCRSVMGEVRYGCSPVDLLHVFRTPFRKNTSGRLLLITPFLRLIFVIHFWMKIWKCGKEEQVLCYDFGQIIHRSKVVFCIHSKTLFYISITLIASPCSNLCPITLCSPETFCKFDKDTCKISCVRNYIFLLQHLFFCKL